MVTGMSMADIALIVVDARRGVSEQCRRHSFLTTLLAVPHLVVCVNKMDLVGWSEEVFQEIREEFTDFAARLRVADLTFIPISALHGDNVVEHSSNTSWYAGGPLLNLLENLHVASDRNLIDVRFPVQYVIRPQSSRHPDYRGYAGLVASGLIRIGDPVLALPSGFTSTITGIDTPDGPVSEALPMTAATLLLADDIDISRGDMLCRPHNIPDSRQDLDAKICWMDESSVLQPGRKYAIKHTTRWGRALVRDIMYRIDVNSLHREEAATQLGLNEIGRVLLRTTVPFFVDNYATNRATGSFILVDESTNRTVGAGVIETH